MILKSLKSSKNRLMKYQKPYMPDIRKFLDDSEQTFEAFKALCEVFCPRSDIKSLFESIKDRENHVSVAKLTKWLNENQRDPRLNEILFPLWTEDGNNKFSITKIMTQMLKDLKLNPDVSNGVPYEAFKEFIENEVAISRKTWALDR